eukprot:m.69439 g.69439  ORF g.69439 m.69439 type:complete len:181 (+) comp16780_c0_seq1:108-650(+)
MDGRCPSRGRALFTFHSDERNALSVRAGELLDICEVVGPNCRAMVVGSTRTGWVPLTFIQPTLFRTTEDKPQKQCDLGVQGILALECTVHADDIVATLRTMQQGPLFVRHLEAAAVERRGHSRQRTTRVRSCSELGGQAAGGGRTAVQPDAVRPRLSGAGGAAAQPAARRASLAGQPQLH